MSANRHPAAQAAAAGELVCCAHILPLSLLPCLFFWLPPQHLEKQLPKAMPGPVVNQTVGRKYESSLLEQRRVRVLLRPPQGVLKQHLSLIADMVPLLLARCSSGFLCR